jgi:Ser/Thr protein kinase RdoA (MazF antagonist)
MFSRHLISDSFAARINASQTTISAILDKASTAYDLGEITRAKGVEVGYEDVNIKLRTKTGTYLVKIFGTFRSYDECVAYYQGILAVQSHDIPVPKLYQQRTGQYLLAVEPQQGTQLHLIVMEYFEGKDFLTIPPTQKDVAALLGYLDKMHRIMSHVPPEVRDPWEPQFLLEEFGLHEDLLRPDDRELVAPVVTAAKSLDLGKFAKGLIHADLMRNNCLKDSKGRYCLLDFGALSQNYIVIDVAIFIAGFCLDPLKTSLADNQSMLDFVMREYKKYDSQPQLTAQALPLLVAMTYASYLLAALVEKAGGNMTDENEYWIAMGREGLRLLSHLKI